MDEVQGKKAAESPASEGDKPDTKLNSESLRLGFSDFSEILKIQRSASDGKPAGSNDLTIEGGDDEAKAKPRTGNRLELAPREDYLNLPDGKALLELMSPGRAAGTNRADRAERPERTERIEKVDGARTENGIEERGRESEPPLISIVPGFDQSSLPTGGNRGIKPVLPFIPRGGQPSGADNFYNRDNNFPGNPGQNRFEQGFRRFMSDPAVQDRIGAFLDNPEVKRGITEVVQRVGAEMGVRFDAQKGEVNLNMDFASLYDRSVPRDSKEYSPEVRTMLSNLDNVNLSADRVNMQFRSEQIISMGDKGIAAQYKLATGADRGRTSMDVDTTEKTLSLKNIQGLQVVERSGRRLNIHQINLDSTNPDDPKGSITMDNPLPRPKFLPESMPWPETVTVPMMIPEEQKAELAEKLPTTIKTMDAIRAGAKSGDLMETLKRVSMADVNQMLGWSFQNRGTIDFQSAWRPPSMRSLYEQGADQRQDESGPRPGQYDPRVRK